MLHIYIYDISRLRVNNVLPTMSMTSKDISFLQIFVKRFCMHFSSAILDARHVRTISLDLIILIIGSNKFHPPLLVIT